MNKKILTICIIGIFVMMSFSSFTTAKKLNNNIRKNIETTNSVILEAYAYIGETRGCRATVNLGNKILPAGDYTAKLKIDYLELTYDKHRVSGYWTAKAQIGDKVLFHERRDFDYTGKNEPEDIDISVTDYIGAALYQKYASVSIYVFYDKFQNYNDYVETVSCQDQAQRGFYFPREKTTNEELIKYREKNDFIENNLNNPPYKPKLKLSRINNNIAHFLLCQYDPDHDDMFLTVDYGFGITVEYPESNPSCDDYESYDYILHFIYPLPGTYYVKVKVRDEYGLESEWSDPLPITVTKSKNKEGHEKGWSEKSTYNIGEGKTKYNELYNNKILSLFDQISTRLSVFFQRIFQNYQGV